MTNVTGVIDQKHQGNFSYDDDRN